MAVVAYTEYASDPRVRKEAEALAGSGFTVTVISLTPKGGRGADSVKGVRVCEVPLTLRRGTRGRYLYQYALFFLLSAALLFALHLRHRFVAIHVHSLPDFQVFCAWPERILGAKVVIDLHEAMPEILAARFSLAPDAKMVRVAGALEKLSCAFADRIIVPATIRLDRLVSRGVDVNKIAVVSNAPNETFLNAGGQPGDRLDPSLRDRWVIVHVGGINEERDLETLIDACRILSQTHPAAILVFGQGDESYLRQLKAQSPATEDRLVVRFGGWIPPETARGYIDLSTVGVVTYRRNPITELAVPNRLMEFAAAGKPLVVADVRGVRMVWEGAALFYEPGDAKDLAAKIHRLIEDRTLALELVRKARLIYDNNDWSHSKSALLSLFKDLHRGAP